jgi:hypothetical protein
MTGVGVRLITLRLAGKRCFLAIARSRAQLAVCEVVQVDMSDEAIFRRSEASPLNTSDRDF